MSDLTRKPVVWNRKLKNYMRTWFCIECWSLWYSNVNHIKISKTTWARMCVWVNEISNTAKPICFMWYTGKMSNRSSKHWHGTYKMCAYFALCACVCYIFGRIWRVYSVQEWSRKSEIGELSIIVILSFVFDN